MNKGNFVKFILCLDLEMAIEIESEKNTMKKSFVFLFFVLLSLMSFALKTSTETLHLLGWVLKEEKPIRKATIGVWLEGKLMYETQSNRWGHFSLDVPLEKNYILTFSAPDLITKKVAVDTRITQDFNANNYYSFEFEVELFENAPWIRDGFFDDPVAMVYYDSYEKFFDYDQEHYQYYLARFEEMKNQGVQEPFTAFLASVQTSGVGPAASSPADGPLTPDLRSNELFAEISPQYSNYYRTAQPIPINAYDRSTEATLPEMQYSAVYDRASTITYSTPVAGAQSNASTETVINNQNNQPLPPNTNSTSTQNPQTLRQNKYPLARNLEVLSDDVVFSVQVLATARPVGDNFFTDLLRHFPETDIIYFKDVDNLDKFAVGVFVNLQDAMNQLRTLRGMHYETYIVAFKDGKRIRVKEALASL